MRKTFQPSDALEVPDLDVTPVMNMFIVLIPFLITMVVFTRLAVLHFSLPPDAGSGITKTEEKPRLKLTVVVAEKYLAITHGETVLDSIASVKGAYDVAALSERLLYHRSSTETLSNEAIVAVRDRIAFEDVVRIMDICRTVGFGKIGLSNATEDPHKGV
jgi:biopolymer transport protein ExbD